MAITITQEIDPMVASIKPSFLSWTCDESTVHIDYKYLVTLSDYTGELVSYHIIAQSNDLFGTIDPTQYIDGTQYNVFTPTINKITKVSTQIRSYQLDIQTYNNGAYDSSNSATGKTFFVNRAANVDFTTTKLLVDHTKKKLTLDSYFYNQSFYGKFSTHAWYIRFNRLKFEMKRGTTTYTWEISHSFPYTHMSTDYDLYDTSDCMLALPVGPANVTEMLQTVQVTEHFESGISHTGLIPDLLQDGDVYKYSTWRGNLMKVSDWYEIEIEECETRFEPVDLYWLNDTGAYDAITVYSKSEESITNNQDNYLKNEYIRSGNKMVESDYNIGLTPYKDNINDFLTMTTNWLNKDEIDELRELWVSPEMYVNFNGEFRSVVITDIGAIIYNENSKGLKKYTIPLQFAKKRYRIK